MNADVLSDVLRAVRLTGAVYFDNELSSPWVAEMPPSSEIAGQVMPGAQRVIEYHLITRGACWGHAVGQEPIRLQEGDLIVFPQGDAHVLSSAPGMRAKPDMSRYTRPSAPLPLFFELGGGGPRRDGRPTPDAVPRPVAHAACVAASRRRRAGGGGRRRRRVRIGGGVQPHVQEARRERSGHLAKGSKKGELPDVKGILPARR